MNIGWLFYFIGFTATLMWKWLSYCFDKRNEGLSFKQRSLNWLEIKTLGSKVSWGATIGGVWLLGSIFITNNGVEWLASGIMEDVTKLNAFKFFIGSLAELIVPALSKKIVGMAGGDV